MRRRPQSPLFPLFQVYGIDEFQILCKFCVFQRQYISYISVGEIELCARCFLPELRRLCTNSASYVYENKSASNGAQLVAIGMPIFAEISVS